MLKGKWICHKTKKELKEDVNELAISRPLVKDFLLQLMEELSFKIDEVSLIAYRELLWIPTLPLERLRSPGDDSHRCDDRRQRLGHTSQRREGYPDTEQGK